MGGETSLVQSTSDQLEMNEWISQQSNYFGIRREKVEYPKARGNENRPAYEYREFSLSQNESPFFHPARDNRRNLVSILRIYLRAGIYKRGKHGTDLQSSRRRFLLAPDILVLPTEERRRRGYTLH